MIENLPVLMPDAARGAHTIARCHDRLAARRRRIEARTRPTTSRTAIKIERLLLAGVCVAYLVAMAGQLFSVAGAY